MTQGQLNILNELLGDNIENLLDEFGVKYNNNYSYISCPCFIHGGRKNTALNISTKEHPIYPLRWKCWTHPDCNLTFSGNLLGLVRGYLSRSELEWSVGGDEIFPWSETVRWACGFLGVDETGLAAREIKVDRSDLDIKRFIKDNEPKADGNKLCVNRNDVRKTLIIPPKQYIDKGYSFEILNKYDIGLYKYAYKRLSNRIVVPLYDSNGYMIAATARSIFDKCNICDSYHSGKCTEFISPKWLHTPKGFSTSNYLFNFYNNLELIKKRKSVIICESIGDVLRLEDCGIKGAVAIFGTQLKAGQVQLLDSVGVMSLIILLNNDDAGKSGVATIKNHFYNYYRLITPNILPDNKDIGDLSNNEIISIKPTIEKTIYSLQRIYSNENV